jgi:hypothetical protein
MLYHDTVTQAQVLAYMDNFWLLAVLFSAILFLIPLMRRVRVEPAAPVAGSAPRGAQAQPGQRAAAPASPPQVIID